MSESFLPFSRPTIDETTIASVTDVLRSGSVVLRSGADLLRSGPDVLRWL